MKKIILFFLALTLCGPAVAEYNDDGSPGPAHGCAGNCGSENSR